MRGTAPSRMPSRAQGSAAMSSRPIRLWSCFALLCAACSLDSSPKARPQSSEQGDAGAWQPRGVGTGRRIDSESGDVADAAKPDAQPASDAVAGARASSPNDGGARDPQPVDASQDSRAPEPAANVPSAGADAPSSNDPASGMPSAGSGGVAGDGALGAAGSAGGAGSGEKSARQSLIDAAIEALGGGEYPWRSGGNSGDGLSADFVKSVLFSLVASGTCFRDTRRCIQTCFVIAGDCEPCAADPECAEALRTVCGPLGECSP